MLKGFDEASYDEGRAAFNAGASLRSMLEAAAQGKDDAADEKAISAILGFADGALDRLRGIAR